jgi:hypothetical protein
VIAVDSAKKAMEFLGLNLMDGKVKTPALITTSFGIMHASLAS